MDPAQRKRLYDDLRGIVRGELLLDELSCVLYSTDASLFEVEPLGVVVPRDEEDLCALIRYAGENQVTLIPRGAGTGRTGAALGSGLIVDLSVHFRDRDLTQPDQIAVEAGVPLRELTRELAAQGRRLVLDADDGEGTIGGLLATNPLGPRSIALGSIREQVLDLRVVLDSGEAFTVHRASRWPAVETPPGRLEDVVSSTITLLEQHQDLIQACRPRTPQNHCGYAVQDVLRGDELQLARLLVGSEGTLGLFTRARLKTMPIPKGRVVVLLAFTRLDAALRAATLAGPTQPTACELLDRRLLRLARSEQGMTELVPEGAEAALIVEYEADHPEQASALGAELVARVRERERLALWARRATEAAEAERLWQFRQSAYRGLMTLRGATQPLGLIDDVAVPPEKLPEYLTRLQDVLRRQETTATFLIHMLSGQVDMRLFLDLQSPRDVDRLWALADEVYTLVLELGGTISAGQGTGLSRMPWVGRQVGRLAPVLKEIKGIFDPRYLFNPGKIVPGPEQPITWPFRRRIEPAKPVAVEVTEPTLHWRTTTAVLESQACNGCGTCRTEETSERMCPIFRATKQEAATPRAKANLMRHLLEGKTDPGLLSSDEVRAVADLCVNCKMCVRECPSRVQIPKLMLMTKAANVARHGMDRADWVLARTESFAHVGSALAPLTNALMANPVARWVLERFFGVSRQRRLPRFASRSFLRLAKQRGWTRKPRSARPRVAYFVDLFANYNDPLIAQSVVEVLHHNGIEVYVPPGQVGCGMAPLAYGDVETAREMALRNLRLLGELAREGFPILCSEPTAAVMLRQDAIDLLGDSEAEVVASQVVEFTAFVWDLHQQGLLKTDFRPLEVAIGHHVPCHIKALDRPAMGPALLSLIPKLRVGTIDVSCSGMAGTFGFKSEQYEVSLAAGKAMLEELSRPAYLFGSTECSACRLQMEDGTRKRTLHPAQYLALAYGLIPAVEQRLREPIGEWVLQ